MSHSARIALGALLTAVGLAGTLALGPAIPVTAQSASSPAEIHETMDTMMDAMHGPGTADRMHQGPRRRGDDGPVRRHDGGDG